MSTYPVLAIPAATDVPAQSQSQLQNNFSNIIGWAAVDHVGFGSTNAGTHDQVTMVTSNVPSTPALLTGVAYTQAGNADTGASQLFFANKDGFYQVSPVKAWGCFTGSSGGLLAGQSVNVSSVTRNGQGQYTVVMASGAVTGTNYAIFLSGGRRTSAPTTNCMVINYTISSATQFAIYAVDPITNTVQDPVQVSFSVIQL